MYPADETSGDKRANILKFNKICWYITFFIGPIVSVVVYAVFILEAKKENNILRAWSLVFAICEIFNFISFFAVINDFRDALSEQMSAEPTWVRIIKETVDKVAIHDIEELEDYKGDFRKEAVVYNIISEAAAYRVCPKFQIIKEYEQEKDR